ncbi:MAG TPA: SEC-C metal-binding domain-containing protein [Gammaproteobacteria bacterium]
MKPGRNDACPCGSGKKYKHCCSAAEWQGHESPAEVTWRRVRRATEGFPSRMARFVAEVYGAEAVDEAWAAFTVWEGDEFDPESPLGAVFLPWMYHCWAPDPLEETCVADTSLHGRPPTSVFLARRGARLDPLHRRYLEACLGAPFSFHEIRRCDAGHGFRARDVITGEEREVLERSASAMMQAGDILFGQLVPIEGIVLLEACSPFPLRPADKITIVELRKRIASAPSRDLFAQDLLHAWNIELRELYLNLVAEVVDPTPPVINNTDGEFILPQRVVFDIDGAESAFAALKHLALGETEEDVLRDAERDEDGTLVCLRFDWRKAGNRLHASWDNTVLGHLEITRDRLVADVNSAERADAFRKIVEDTLGGCARYRGSELPTAAGSAAAADAAGDEGRCRRFRRSAIAGRSMRSRTRTGGREWRRYCGRWSATLVA